MPPVRRPRSPQAQTSRCRYVNGHGERCRRVATVGGGLCRGCAVILELELDDEAAKVVGTLDRALAQRGTHDPITTVFVGAINGVLGRIFQSNQQRARIVLRPTPLPHPGQPRTTPQPPPPPRPPPRPPVDPTIRAREILGFEPAEPLTIDKVQKRKQALARVFHPDMAGGSEAHMKRVLAAADILLARLAKSP